MRTYSRLLKGTTKVIDKYSLHVPKEGYFPRGYKVGSIATGVKKNGQLDLGVIVNTFRPGNNPEVKTGSAAAVFTTNKFKAAPVLLSRDILSSSNGRGINAIVINSGCANSVTGEPGLADAKRMVSLINEHLGTGDLSTLVMSTGVIGQRLQMDKISQGIDSIFNENKFGNTYHSWLDLAKSICTTDTFPKLVTSRFTLDRGTTHSEFLPTEYTLTGIAKGAGMICPNMATLLGLIVTDLPIEPTALQSMLTYSVNRSFNCISVDGDMSTNDTICMLANGAARGPEITLESPEFEAVQFQITEVAQRLAQLVCRDVEGSTKFVTVNVANCLNFDDAKIIAESIANSTLVKTALYGEDANWGRIMCAIGYAKLGDQRSLDPDKMNVSFVAVGKSEHRELPVVVNGVPNLDVDERRASEILASDDLEILVDLGTGTESAKFWTCDLSHEYVTINGDYRT